MGGNKVAAPTGGKQQAPARTGAGKTYSGKTTGQPSVGVPRVPRASGGGGAGSAELEAAVAKADEKNAELQMNNDTLDREREFYFGKLRDIEEMLQKKGLDQDPLGSEVLKILYASEEE